jgi:hypothetical protein
MSYDYVEGEKGSRSKYTVSWKAPVVANEWTRAQPGIDANNRVRQHDLAFEKRFITKDAFTRLQTTVFGILCTNAVQGWCNIINQGRRETPRVLAREIGMGLLAHLRADRAVPLSLSVSLGISHGTADGSSSIRASPGKYMPVSFRRGAGKGATFQRKCVVCGKDTSFFCSLCGEQCAVHPLHVRGRPDTVGCMEQHRRDPIFRFRRDPRAPSSDPASRDHQQRPTARRRLH